MAYETPQVPGGGGDELQHNFAATAAPEVTNDVSEGYSVGSRWIDVTNDEAYICVDATEGAAVWELSTAGLASEVVNVPAGNIAATSVQAAINELDTEKQAAGNYFVKGTDDADDVPDGTTNKAYTATEKTKLAGVETAADVTDAGNVGSSIHGSSAKATPVDADTMPLIDSAASNVLKKVTWANIKATLQTYFDTVYQALDAELTAIAGLVSAANKIPRFTGSGTADMLDFKDEDNMASDSASAVPSQQSVKAYVDANGASELVAGPQSNTKVKTYMTFQFPFLFATGLTLGATTTDFGHWTKSGNFTVAPNLLQGYFTSTGEAYMNMENLWKTDAAGSNLQFADSNIVIMDWWAKKISGTGYGKMGFNGDNSYLTDIWNGNNNFAGFFMDNATLYAVTQRISGNDRQTDISSGVTLTNWNNFRLEFDLGADIVRFYVNGVLKHTDNTDSVPTAGTCHFGFGRDTTNPLIYLVTAPHFSIEANP